MKQTLDYVSAIYLDEGKNCAETMFRAALLVRGRTASKEMCLALGGFSGGVSVGHLCGAIVGGTAAIGALMNHGDEQSFEACKEATAAFFVRCKQELGTELCDDLKPCWRKEDTRCLLVVERTAAILDEVLSSFNL